MANFIFKIGLSTLAIYGLISCGYTCNVDQVKLIVEGLSRVLSEESGNMTQICTTLEQLNGMSKTMRKALTACNGNMLKTLVGQITSYQEKQKSVQSFANMYGCKYDEEIITIFPETSSKETVGCSAEGVKSCYAIVNRFFDNLKNGSSAAAESAAAERAQFCRLYTNPEKLDACFTANTYKCVGAMGVKNYKDMEREQLDWKERLNVGITQCADAQAVAACEKNITLLNWVQDCSQPVVSKVYSLQDLNWPVICKEGFSAKQFSSCVEKRTKEGNCPSLAQDLKTKAIDQANAFCKTESPVNDNPPAINRPVAKDYTSNQPPTTGSLGLPPLLEAVVKEALSQQSLGSWKVYGGGKGTTVVLNFGDGYVPKDTCVKQCGPP